MAVLFKGGNGVNFLHIAFQLGRITFYTKTQHKRNQLRFCTCHVKETILTRLIQYELLIIRAEVICVYMLRVFT